MWDNCHYPLSFKVNVDPPEQMIPNTCQRKKGCVNDIVDVVKDLQLSENDNIDVICLSLKKLGIFDKKKEYRTNQCRSKIDTNFNKVISLELLAQKLLSINNYIQASITSCYRQKQNTRKVRICRYNGDCYEKEASILSKPLVYY